MARPRMTVIAGPPGSGKSTRLPLSSFSSDFFNADDRAAKLNGGSYHKISKDIYGNSRFDKALVRSIELRQGKIAYLADQISPWLEEILHATEFNIRSLRAAL